MVLGCVLCCLRVCAAVAGTGDWPEPRQNPFLTAIQSVPGAMTAAPGDLARFDLGRSRPAIRSVADGTRNVGLCIVAGALRCYATTGAILWESHPPGLNFTQITAAEDLDGDSKVDVLLMAGRPADPFAEAVLVSLADGKVIWRYDVDPMSYQWYLYTGHYLPDSKSSQIVVIMHGYPPDKKNGYMALFDYPRPGDAPRQRWRYDFSEYTCFPSFLQTDLDGDGVKEFAIETHSRMWLLDAASGKVKQFIQWDVSPSNVRSYGLVRFVDLNRDGRDDFLCIGNFSQHHEVLLNRNGKLEEAWHHGWDESVITGKVATAWPEPPYVDVDGDGKLEIALSMFNSEGEGAWLLRVYDALTGVIKYRFPRAIAVSCSDVDNDGSAGILVNLSDDPTRTVLHGACLLKVRNGKLTEIWRDDHATAVASVGGKPRVQRDGKVFTFATKSGRPELEPWIEPPHEPGPDYSAIPPMVGPAIPMLFAADLIGDRANELVFYEEPNIDVLQLSGNQLKKVAQYKSSSLPVMTDLDGDGKTDLVLTTVQEATTPLVEAITPALDNRRLWRTTLPEAKRSGLPWGRKAYVRPIHLTGRPTPDLYLWAGLPLVRSVGLDGRTGDVLWEKGELPGIERFCGPGLKPASAFDVNHDGKEDLVFTNPDFYCVANGLTGDLLEGPISPQTIFKQSSQGLYTLPAILEKPREQPTVCLISGHYFQGIMTTHAEPHWYSVPDTGENRAAVEGFLKADDGAWCMGFGRQNGKFACVNVADGTVRWELPIEASASDVVTCDVDGDGRQEFVFGTSHGSLYALGDDGARPRLLWKADLGAAVGNPIAADLNGDGSSEIIVGTADGYIHVLGVAGKAVTAP